MEPGLPDELLLLALHNEQGHVLRAAGPALHGALVRAAMMELSLRGSLSEGTGSQLVADPTPTGDEILDDITRRIAEAERRQDAATWVSQLTQELPDLRDRLLDRMVAAGVLERRERRILRVYPSSSFPQGDDRPERQARERIRAAVLEGESPDARTLALISLVQTCHLLDEPFVPSERPAARRRIAELIGGRTAEGPSLATMLGIGALFGLVGATLQHGYRRLRESFGGRVGYLGSDWDPAILEPWVTN
jgi:golgi phosphoprotein 3